MAPEQAAVDRYLGRVFLISADVVRRLDGYRSRREDHEIAIFLAGGGALLVWFLERRPLRAGGIIGILIGLFWLVLVLSQDF